MTKNDLLQKAEEYMKLKYRFELTEDEAEGGYMISYPDLVGCISTGETIEEAVKNGEDARREWIIATLESGMEVPVSICFRITANNLSNFVSCSTPI